MSTRREFLSGACAAGLAAAWPGRAALAGDQPAGQADSAGEFTFVHLTDMHVTRRRQGHEGYKACIKAVRKHHPALVLMGGDMPFDGNYTAKDDFEDQIRLFKDISDGLGCPWYPCMGNHDVLGWSSRRKVPVSDPELGKKMIMDRLKWEKSYYSFDHAGWHFVMLDSIFPVRAESGPSYEPRIGDAQLAWLARDLGAAAGRPTVAVTHIAAFCNRGQLGGAKDSKAMDGHMVLWDTKELRTILERHKVKALLQGHSHDIEQYCYNDVWYLTSAAASGAWWAGGWVGSDPGFTVFRCRGGQLSWTHETFPWEPRLDPQDNLERERLAQQKAFEAEQAKLLEQERKAASK